MRRTGLYVLFFLSGASALIYELVWQRQLNLVFGVSTLSVSVVVAAYMGGLALGGHLCGRFVDRLRRPLWSYALLEAGICVAGLLLPAGSAGLSGVYTALYAAWQPGSWGGVLLRFAIAFPLLAGLAALIGATLPIMGRLTVGDARNLPRTFSAIYAVNTLGGVVGAALTGFILLRCLGMRETLWIAAGLNALVACAAGLSSLLEEKRDETWDSVNRPDTPTPTAGASKRGAVLALACVAVTGAVGMGLEVGWSRVLGILTSNSAYGFALLLSVLLLGLGVGGLIQALWSRREGNPWGRLACCQWLLAAITIGSLPFFHASPNWLDRWCDGRSTAMVFLGEATLTALALFLPGVLMGMSMPLLLAGVTNDPKRFGLGLGRLNAVNALGCAGGALSVGFFLIPWLGIHGTFAVLVGGTLLAARTAWRMAAQLSWRWKRFVGLAATGVLAAAWFVQPSEEFLKSPVREPRQVLYYREGNNATVNVIQEPTGTRSIFVDGQPVAGTAGTSVVDQKMLAHLPLLLHPAPKRALTVGFGSGGTSSSMALHGVDVDCVEIEAAVPGAAELFQSENHGVLNQSRFRLIVDDARSWLHVAPERYDVIVTDCTNIQYRSNGDLYTVEYFELMKDRLATDGVAAAWVPANGIRDTDLKTLLRSFRRVFPHTSVWYMNPLATDFLIVIGTPHELQIDMEELSRRMSRPGVREDLAAVGLTDPCRLVYSFLATGGNLASYIGPGALNTDDRPILSYSTYGATFESTIASNLVGLVSCREDVAMYTRRCVSEQTMLRHYVASNEMLLGHISYLSGLEPAALEHYLKGSGLLPDDPAFAEVVRGSLYRLTKGSGLPLRGAGAEAPPAGN
jgi:spermidine synthase